MPLFWDHLQAVSDGNKKPISEDDLLDIFDTLYTAVLEPLKSVMAHYARVIDEKREKSTYSGFVRKCGLDGSIWNPRTGNSCACTPSIYIATPPSSKIRKTDVEEIYRSVLNSCAGSLPENVQPAYVFKYNEKFLRFKPRAIYIRIEEGPFIPQLLPEQPECMEETSNPNLIEYEPELNE